MYVFIWKLLQWKEKRIENKEKKNDKETQHLKKATFIGTEKKKRRKKKREKRKTDCLYICRPHTLHKEIHK